VNEPFADLLADRLTLQECQAWLTEQLKDGGEKNAGLAARRLLLFATRLDESGLVLHGDDVVSAETLDWLRQACGRRLAGEPLQYITGQVVFRRLLLKIAAGVFIPRPETEMLVQMVIDEGPKRVLDVCCGSGAIALSLLAELPDCHVVATDISEAAVRLTLENAREAAAAPVPVSDRVPEDGSLMQRLEVLLDDLAETLLAEPDMAGRFDAIVSNPPYIPSNLIAMLPDEVGRYEPLLALDGGADGLAVFERLLGQALVLLKPAGLLAVELHESSLQKARLLAVEAGFKDVQVHLDLTIRPRFLTARR